MTPHPRKPFLDNSAYSAWWKCPYFWFEQYIAQQVKEPPEGHIDSALTLGSCVHAGLEVLRTRGVVEIPPGVITDTRVSPDYAAWAKALVAGYAAHYPGEDFPSGRCEEPLRFPLEGGQVDGLAKVDYYWEVPEGGQEISDGLGGTLHLEAGIWIKEYKTKDPSRRPGNWVLSWATAAQADFQCLALAAVPGFAGRVRGVLVDTLEKPKPYIPQRSCKGCKAKQDLRYYTPVGEGLWRCPLCQHEQKLDVADKSKADRTLKFYRIKVQRSPEQLALSHSEFSRVAAEMQQIREGTQTPIRRTVACVDQTFGACTYREPHAALQSAEGWEGFVRADTIKYVGEEPDGED